MRYLTILCLIAFGSSVQAEPFSKDICRQYAEAIEGAASTYRKSLQAEGDGRLLDFSGRATGPMLDASKKAVESGLRYRTAQREYISSLEDLSHQFRVCAR